MRSHTLNKKETPLMRQHRSIKEQYPDAILLFRVGDFYETFGEDAIAISRILSIALTKRNSGPEKKLELAGFPHHALDSYLHKIVQAGRRVAICDQLEDPKRAKGIVKRGVTEVVTPGVTTNDKILNISNNNFLACLHFESNIFGLAFVDISTNAFYVAEGDLAFAQKLLTSFSPSEVLVSKPFFPSFEKQIGKDYHVYTQESWVFDYTFNKDALIQHFKLHHSLKGFGLEKFPLAIICAGVALHYLKSIKHPNLAHLQHIQHIRRDTYMWLDQFTIKNLELITGEYPLIKIIDKTKSPMGARLLRHWLLMPLQDRERIDKRLSTTSFFVEQPSFFEDITKYIAPIGDLERIIHKVPTRKINPREVAQIAQSLNICKHIKKLCADSPNPYLQELASQINSHDKLYEIISKTLTAEPSIQIGKSELIQPNVNTELDDLRNLLKSNKDSIQAIQQQAIVETKISSLKVGFNNVFGYYLEVSNAHKSKVPTNWTRKQTLTHAERYITQELKQYEERVLQAQDRILQLEQEIFEQVILKIEEQLISLSKNCTTIAIIDCLRGFSQVANLYNYTRPSITNDRTLILKAVRHPVIEQHLSNSEGTYIANDILLDNKEQQIAIITGPNMSGKSAILRQTALNVLLAHIGCFVACSKAKIPLTDSIFTRVGAQDNLAQGESTFMLEMNETASILNNLSENSLILLDEIGRGTSTYDGISIAWSILEYLATHSTKPKTLFSTHYHEIIAIEEQFSNIKNFHISNKEENGNIVFLRKLIQGGSTHSFGIHVAQMAGLPQAIIQRAQQILLTLEEKESLQDRKKQLEDGIQSSLELFKPTKDESGEALKRELASISIEHISPIEALLKLRELKNYI